MLFSKNEIILQSEGGEVVKKPKELRSYLMYGPLCQFQFNILGSGPNKLFCVKEVENIDLLGRPGHWQGVDDNDGYKAHIAKLTASEKE